MKHSIKISVMALVAMFAVSTTADAQFGLLKSIGKDLGIKGKKKVKDPKTGETIKIKEDEFVVRNWKTGEDEIVKIRSQKLVHGQIFSKLRRISRTKR